MACLESKNLFASIDLGTNSFKLQIIHFEPKTVKFTTFINKSESVGLGRHSSSPSSSSSPSPSSPQSLICPESQLRAIEALTKFVAILRCHNVTQIRVVGTSAIREASNRSIFLNEEHRQLDGYTNEEIQLLAHLVRHHRKKFPSFECFSLQGFSKEKFGIICSILRISVLIQQQKLLKHREFKFYDSSEGFVLALVKKGDQPILLDSETLLAKEIQAKIAKEAELFEKVFHQKLLVVTHMGCIESSTRH